MQIIPDEYVDMKHKVRVNIISLNSTVMYKFLYKNIKFFHFICDMSKVYGKPDEFFNNQYYFHEVCETVQKNIIYY